MIMKRIHIITIAALLTLAGGCKKWLDINTDPANPQEGSAEILLSPVQYQMANNLVLDYRMLMKYIQNWGSVSAGNVWETHGYEPASDNGGSIWRMTYINLGPNLELLIKDAVQKEKWTYAGIGYAIKAWAFQLTTDYHGPIILDQAFDTTRLFFNYQDQPDVYARVRQWCDSAIACLGRTDKLDYTGILAGPSGDYIYKGNRDLWKKFVYGVLALQYSHLTNKANFASSYADSVVKYVDLSFANTKEDPTLDFTSTNSADASLLGVTAGYINPTSTTNGLTGRIAEPIVKLLTGGVRGTAPDTTRTSLDPRLSRMLAPAADTVYRGVVPTYGDARVPHVWGSVSAPFPGKYLFSDKARYPFMSFSQLQFAKAEALFIQNKTDQAYDAYLKGIGGHMDFVNEYGLATESPLASTPITSTQRTAYMTSSEVAQTSADLTIADIMSQKYIAQWGWAGIEQWCDLRKYHYDTAVFKNLHAYTLEELYPANQGKPAHRVRPRYNSEYVWNRDELEKWGGLELDYHTKELWFTLPE